MSKTDTELWFFFGKNQYIFDNIFSKFKTLEELFVVISKNRQSLILFKKYFY